MRNWLLLSAISVVLAVSGCEFGSGGLALYDRDCAPTDTQTFEQRAEARLRELENRIEELHDRSVAARADMAESLRRDVAELRQKNEEARRRLTEMWQAGIERRQERRERMEEALDDLRLGVERAFSRFQ